MEINLLIRCEGMMKYGLVVYVDFYKINWICNCVVILLFDGDLFVLLMKVVLYYCNI